MDNHEGRAPRDCFSKAVCGWGCFCDACWIRDGGTTKSSELETREWLESPSIVADDPLWRLAFGDGEVCAQSDRGIQYRSLDAHRAEDF